MDQVPTCPSAMNGLPLPLPLPLPLTCQSSMNGRSALILARATESGTHDTSRTWVGLRLGAGIGLKG